MLPWVTSLALGLECFSKHENYWALRGNATDCSVTGTDNTHRFISLSYTYWSYSGFVIAEDVTPIIGKYSTKMLPRVTSPRCFPHDAQSIISVMLLQIHFEWPWMILSKNPPWPRSAWSAPEKPAAPDRVQAQRACVMVLWSAHEGSWVLVRVQSWVHEGSGVLRIHRSGWSHPPRSGAKPVFAEDVNVSNITGAVFIMFLESWEFLTRWEGCYRWERCCVIVYTVTGKAHWLFSISYPFWFRSGVVISDNVTCIITKYSAKMLPPVTFPDYVHHDT
jgi:hypothetical protein